MADNCGTCKFLVSKSGTKECRRNPPMTLFEPFSHTSGKAPNAWWPSVSPSDWCGEYVSKNAGVSGSELPANEPT